MTTYTRVHPSRPWTAPGREALYGGETAVVDNVYMPKSVASVAESRTLTNAPSDANYIVWQESWGDIMLEEVFIRYVTGANDILVLPERFNADGTPRPYYVDSQYGFRAAGVAEVSTSTGRLAVTNTYLGQTARTWFSMARARRGILGMGPGSVIEPSPSSMSWPAQPYPMTAYFQSGATQELVGCQNALLEFVHTQPFLGNLRFRSRDLGGVSYNTVRANYAIRCHFDGSWRGFSGVPNGETGGLILGAGGWRIDSCTFRSNGGPSPIMWNRTTSGGMKHVKASKPNHGMFTFWRSGGANVFEDVYMEGKNEALNLEEGGPGFSITWTGGSISTDGQYHFIGESSPGSKVIRLNNVSLVGGRIPGTLCLHFYSYTGIRVQKKTDITRNDGPTDAVGNGVIS